MVFKHMVLFLVKKKHPFLINALCSHDSIDQFHLKNKTFLQFSLPNCKTHAFPYILLKYYFLGM